MPQRKEKMFEKNEPDDKKNYLVERIRKLSENLYYISETDAEILPFAGKQAKAVTREEILRQTGNSPDAPVEERDFAEVFKRLTKIQDWFGEEETATAERFAVLQKFLEKNLKDLKIFKIGKVELDVYFVGLDERGVLTGIKTKAVET
jgi:hypothetical protein